MPNIFYYAQYIKMRIIMEGERTILINIFIKKLFVCVSNRQFKIFIDNADRPSLKLFCDYAWLPLNEVFSFNSFLLSFIIFTPFQKN